MGGRGGRNNGAAAAPKIELRGATTDIQEVARRLGFKNVDELQKALELKKFVREHKDAGQVIEHIAEHRGIGGIGPVMLRIGLPRDKLLDIVHALKPLRDHGILTMSMPLSYKGYEDPFKLADSINASDTQGMNALSRTQINALSARIWLKRVKNAPFDLIQLPKKNEG